VERESVGQEPKTQSGLRTKLTIVLRVMRVFIWGIAISSYFGSMLLAIRMPNSHWRIAPMLILALVMILSLLRKDDTKVSVVTGCLWPAWVGGCVAGLFFMRTHDWVPVAAGALFAIFFWLHSKSTNRPYLFLSVGSLLAGLLSLQFPWPNEQRCLLTLVGVGLTATLQGAGIIVRYLQGQRLAEFSEPVASSSKSSDKGIQRFFQGLFGTIEPVQIYSPEFERRIRARYQSESDQLANLGFDHLFFFGEAFPLIRLLLLIPALIVFQMWLKRVPMTVYEGTKNLSGNPVFASKDKTAYAHPNSLGVTFHTAFQDGTILTTKNYGDPTDYGPTVEAQCMKGASISDLWTAHQRLTRELETAGKHVDRQISFQAYAEISRKETAA